MGPIGDPVGPLLALVAVAVVALIVVSWIGLSWWVATIITVVATSPAWLVGLACLVTARADRR
jgi:Flp pilus assembly protein TadB